MAVIQSRRPQIIASWSILLAQQGRHVPHLHDGGPISSAVHITVPTGLRRGEGLLELGRPPEDIPMELDRLTAFKPKPGHLVLFPSFIYHSTSRFSDGERLTAAFDAV
ncbi:MAG: putative 2OG-Fe(II) oxygenase [Erythrobacter sp.]|uniref:putative 2OG-Fe(II) oxygenase n=1 Tax=Erythrobacter sp. TaxID=1042 RepID=UPI0032670EEF